MTVAVIYGGKSCEHNISVITGVQAMAAMRGHRTVPIYIDGDGVWYTGPNFDDINAYRQGRLKKKRVFVKPYSRALFSDRGKKLCTLDAALLCNHGLNGEDGSLQGLLQLCGIPFTGSGVRASAAAMDKIVMKQLFAANRLKVTRYRALDRARYESNLNGFLQELSTLDYPLIVKPSNLGSSIGISLARNVQELFTALRVAFEWDNRVLVEEALTDFIELNCAVLQRGKERLVSEVEQPVGWKDFLTFADKYEKSKLKSDSGGRYMPAHVSEKVRARVRAQAVRAFDAVGAAGVARVDFLYDETNGRLFVNEINTIPGSLSGYLFAYDGLSESELIDALLEDALDQQRARDRLKYSYKSTYGTKGNARG